MINHKQCPVCNSEQTEFCLHSKDYFLSKETFDIWACRSCGLKYTNPRPEDKDLSGYYQSEEYISHSNTGRGLVSILYKWVRNYTLGTKERLLRRFVSRGTLLDYGAGTGHFLAYSNQRGWRVYGVEPDEGARKMANERVPQVYATIAELVQRHPEQKFEVITLWHVLEHVPDLDAISKFLSTSLSQNGVLIVAVPNPESHDAKKYASCWAAYDLPRHLWHFNQNSLEVLFRPQGFRLISVRPMRFDSYYVSLLSEKYKGGKASMVAAFLTGWISNLKARATGEYSSKIYIFKKA